ncbi:hypothetical protein [Dethiosulfatarculus sandiegensis]|uniref:Uncharacterized protein n=1 Tax=Dethiosulfatarculus sandiegensis TaxID=1429043 RepID=A0A0D2JYM2_9BACT|nr:hypothetical protein [Dethiosulfatarculus sandiegensis]KIX14645.1 hypothetical protein X474_08115 [Dethiosulfatarculus sandiegensis]
MIFSNLMVYRLDKLSLVKKPFKNQGNMKLALLNRCSDIKAYGKRILGKKNIKLS